jgi:DNA (cytosine-5)-methyltransferase 1
VKTVADLFAGAGGTSEGARQAGLDVIWAANHDPLCVSIHALNHPETTHVIQDLCQADFTQMPDVDIICASPACTGFSKARGKDRPIHDKYRSTAWAVVAAVEAKRPEIFVVENVKEFRDWVLYPHWFACLKDLGYHLTPHLLNAADFGVPQSRERFILTGRRGRPLVIEPGTTPHVSARSVIRMEEGDWGPIEATARVAEGRRPLVPDTLSRIAAGRKVHGHEFLMAYYGEEKGGRSLDKPFGTFTTNDRFAVVQGDRIRMATMREFVVGMGFPENYQLPQVKKVAKKMLGNAVPPGFAKGILSQI